MDPTQIQAEIAVLREQLATLIAIQKGKKNPLTTEQIVRFVTMCTREIMRGAGKQFAITSVGGADRIEQALLIMADDVRSIMLADDAE